MTENVASVISTGGGGTDFEHRVGAYFLALLLTKSFVPIFSDSAPVRVHFQARRLGWHIDDLVIEALSESGQIHMLAVQAKRNFTLGSSDQECKDTFAAAWHDFNNASLFQQGRDAIVLVTYLGTNRIQHDLRWLLTQARAAATAADFLSRRQGEGTLNQRAKADYDSIKGILDEASGSVVADDSVWRFLQSFHVLSFDFQDATGKDEAAIRTILAALRAQNEPIDAAATSWAELVSFSGLAAGQGRSVELATLPEAIQIRHRQVPSTKHGELARLRQHSSVTLRRISEAGPRGIVFERAELRRDLEAALAAHQVVLVTGPAGFGKSVLGKSYLSGSASSDSTFAFAAEEFKAAHIDRVLANANINLTWEELSGLLPLHRKVLLIDGLERLLEASDRAAFKDLLLTTQRDKTISLVITCRDYYAEVVERAFLATSGVDFARVVVGGLSDQELGQAGASAPVLIPLIANQALRPILRNPFLLTHASELRSNPEEPIPQTERALRRRMWGDLVRDDAYVAGGMPAKREKFFLKVCVDRARLLEPYVSISDEDGVLQRLANDSLLVYDDTGLRVATAHDVLEDWGLIEWLTRRFNSNGGSAISMAGEIGDYPALRRGYRKWLAEQLAVDSASLSSFVAEASSDSGIPAHFRDDTWLALFQSVAAEAFMATFSAILLANEAELLRRVLHLVRVGCKTVSPVSKSVDVTQRWHVPAGKAWAILLRFLAEHWSSLPHSMDTQVVGFMEDWAGAISASDPSPEGSDSVGRLFELFFARPMEGAGQLVPREDLIELLLKIPTSNSALFLSLARQAACTGPLENDEGEAHLAKLAFQPLKAMAFARDFPVELQALCRARLLAVRQEDEPWPSSTDVEAVFGLTHSYDYRLFPASASQGPFSFLLRFDISTAVRFIVSFVNEVCTRYRDLSGVSDLIEQPFEAILTLNDGTQKAILCNQRLWQAYRATSVAPAVLECALMALENRLLEIVSHGASAEVVQSYLAYIIRESNNVAALGVVASICTAHPSLAGICGVDILGCPELIRMDTGRMVAEQSAFAPGGLDAFGRMFQMERMESNGLPHRRMTLEWLALQLQFGPTQSAMHDLLDRYVAELPAEGERSGEDIQWLLALRRMDIRTYEQTEVEGGFELAMGPLPNDVSTMVQEAAAGQDQFLRRVGLLNWSRRILENKSAESAGEWRQHLQTAKELEAEFATAGVREILDSGDRMTASVVARDHWSELGSADQLWCLNSITACLEAVPESPQEAFRGSIPVDGSMECASVVGAIAAPLSREDAEGLLVTSLTHFNSHVQFEAVKGLANEAFLARLDLLNYALHILTQDAALRVSQYSQLEGVSWQARPSSIDLLRQRREGLAAMDKAAWSALPPPLDSAVLGEDSSLAISLLQIFQACPRHPFARQVFTWVGDQFAGWWDRSGTGHGKNFELQAHACEAFAEYLIASEPSDAAVLLSPVLAQIDGEPSEVADFVNQLIVVVDRKGDSATFWPLWILFAARVRRARWINATATGRSSGQTLVDRLFLNIPWNDGLREWRLLGDFHREIDNLFIALPAGSKLLEAYGQYLLAVGKRSLPEAIMLVDTKFGAQLESTVQRSKSCKYLLDQLVSRLMFENLSALQRPALRGPMLRVLDALIQGGSSNAFLLREDFLTPSGSAFH